MGDSGLSPRMLPPAAVPMYCDAGALELRECYGSPACTWGSSLRPGWRDIAQGLARFGLLFPERGGCGEN
jgi:hypothetical protein